MKWYKAVFKTAAGVEKEVEFVSKAQAILAIKQEGFQWDDEREVWEQTYCTVDPFNDYEMDTVFTKAEITVFRYGKEVVKGI